ncbi:MAG: amidohydrolase [Acidobacteria bacterium]|nr:amidohydrolase [Acidobacteriota bacterium]
MQSRLLVAAAFLLASCSQTQAPATAPIAAARVPAPSPGARRYVMITGANHAGQQVVSVEGSNRTVDFEFNDRGRGPKTHTVVTVDDAGIPVTLATTGNDYFKGPVEETLTTSGGTAHWKNKAEGGEKGVGAFYVGMYSPPEETGMLAKALLAAPGQRLPLFPAGEASIRRAGDLMLTDGARHAHITHYEIVGLGFEPSDVWLDDQSDYFASVSSWSSVIREEWEAAIPKVLAAQEASGKARIAELAKRLTRRPASLAITGARLFDPATLQVTPDTTIVIVGEKIVSVGADGSVAIPANAERLDAAGKTVIPGLWDMHTHNSDSDGLLDVASGVTTVRDMANDIDFVTGLRKSWGEGSAIGPRLILAGFMDGPGPYAGPSKVLVDSEDDIRKAIDRYASLGYVQIKIYSSMRPELVPFITRYAHSKGLRVSGHIPAFMLAEQAVRQGYDEIQHANMLLLNFLPDVKDTRTPARFTAVGERAAAIDLHSPEVQAFFQLLREHKTVIDPTVAIFEGMFTDRPGRMSTSYAAIADRLPPQVRRGFLTGGLPVPEGMDARYRASFAKMLELVHALYDNGITIVPGTDGLAGFTLHRELELYIQAGIPAPQVLRMATLGAATVMHREADLGSVTPGKAADLVIIDGDPTVNISDIRRPVVVVKNGLLFNAQAVYHELGVN